MKTKGSLRQRVVIAFFLFSIVISLLFGFVTSVATKRVEDYLFNQQLLDELNFFQEKYRVTGQLPESTIPFVTVYTNAGQLPDQIRYKALTHKPGVYELTEDDVHIASANLPGTDEVFYLVYNVRSLELEQRSDIIHTLIHISMSLFCGVIGLVIALMISHRIIRPVTELSVRVENVSPENLPETISDSFADDEVGALAEKCDSFIQRIHAHIEREKQFTRFASHELRSPVTVIKGALELIDSTNLKTNQVQPLDRIRRAVQEMENTLNCFLLLSRENLNSLEKEDINIHDFLCELTDQYQVQFKKRQITVCNLVSREFSVETHRQTLWIVFSNILRNASQYTSNGAITMTSDDHSISISDTGTGINSKLLSTVIQPFVKSPSSSGHGLGLTIINTICQRYHWKFHIDSIPNHGTTVQIEF